MRKLSYLFIFLTLFFIAIFNSFIFVQKQALASESFTYYSFDVKSHFFSWWCYSVKTCSLENPPPGKTFNDLIYDYDYLAFLTSLQGLINRNKPLFYLVASDKPDEQWLNLLKNNNIWLANAQRIPLNSLEEVINTFKGNTNISGSVVWDASQPYTLNLAYTIAGADNLVIVRKDSPLYSLITADFPVRQNLVGKFTSKRSAYQWLIDNYLAAGKTAPIINLLGDGWPVYKYTRTSPKVFLNDHEVAGHGLLTRDYAVAKKAFVIGYGVHPNGSDPLGSSIPTGEGRQMLEQAIGVIRQRLGPGKLFEAWGWPPSEYLFDCNGDGKIDGYDGVVCSEWEWVRLISSNGGVKRVGGGDMYALEAANFSFYQHGPGTDLVKQPPPLTSQKMLDKNYTVGFPKNFSFEENSEAPWIIDTTNRSIYNEPYNAKHGNKFLQVNVSSQDIGKSIYQDLSSVNLNKGYHYRFVLSFRSPSGDQLRGRQVVWAEKNGLGRVMCHNQFEKNNSSWQPLICEFDVKEDGLVKPRLQVYIDTPDKNYSFDEAYFLGPNTLTLNSRKKFIFLYQGDYDFAVVPFVVSTGVYPYSWFGRTNEIPVGWSISSNVSKVIPPIFAYFAKTKGETDWLVMPDSGAGYLNPGSLPDSFTNSWIKETAALHRKFNYRTGWVLDGFDWGEVPTNSSKGRKIRDMYKVIAPEGIVYNGPVDHTRILDGSMGVVPMTDWSWAGDNIEERANKLKEILSQTSSQFIALRNVFVSSSHLKQITDRARALGADFEVLDPITFFYLFRLKHGGDTNHRMSVVEHNIPSKLSPGQSLQVRVKIRNDGWAVWVPKGNYDCDGSALNGSGCYALAWGLKQGEITPTGYGKGTDFPYDYRVNLPRQIFPGEETELSFTLQASSMPGSYNLQLDMIKEIWEFFETNGNVPWLKEIIIGETSPSGDLDGDGDIDRDDFLLFFSKYGLAGPQADLNADGKVNGLDFGEMVR